MNAPEAPIFLGGLSHSGKTQLRVALERHPDLHLTRRTKMWGRYWGRYGDPTDVTNLRRLVRALAADPRLAGLEPDADEILAALEGYDVTYARVFGTVHRLHAERLGKRRWGEQLGGIERFADPIFQTYPGAKIVHMVRDPRTRYAAGQGRRRGGSVGWDTAGWLASVQLAERNRARYPDGYLVVRYESLACAPAATLLEVCTFIGESALPPMVAELERARFDRVDEPRGPDPARRFIETYAGDRLSVFGYPLAAQAGGLAARVTFALRDRPINRAAMTAWRLSNASVALRQGG